MDLCSLGSSSIIEFIIFRRNFTESIPKLSLKFCAGNIIRYDEKLGDRFSECFSLPEGYSSICMILKMMIFDIHLKRAFQDCHAEISYVILKRKHEKE